MIKLIGSMDETRGIGLNNQLLYNSPTDMSYFKSQTEWGVIAMGHNTMESLPKFPLPKRVNIVMSDRPVSNADALVKTKDEIIEASKHTIVWVIGGAKTYEQFIDIADEIHLTIFKGSKEADTFFPPFELFFEEVSATPFKDEEVEGTIIVYKKIV